MGPWTNLRANIEASMYHSGMSEITICNKCGLSEPQVSFSRLKHRERRCDTCFKQYQQKYYESTKRPQRQADPEPSRRAARNYGRSHKSERRQYAVNNADRFRPSFAKSHRKTRGKKLEFIRELKSVPCMDCKNKFPSCVMDFDHRDPSTKTACINKMISHAPWEKTLAEIKKCDVICVNCHRLRTKSQGHGNKYNVTRSKNRILLDELKKFPCTDCRKSFDPCQMDYDHIQSKSRNVGLMLSQTRKKMLAEIAKCELVCANCHRIRTQNRLPRSVLDSVALEAV